ncbi:MAG: hypothetical protein KAG34_01225 [Cocleimonas sp.]|nr:hypothetical protein [Sulfurovaceae bacterium]MCK5917015.1 hypothetical protein [Cocleimonas sp.]
MTVHGILKVTASILIISFLISSCNNEETNSKAEKAQIEPAKDRAVARWNALIDRDWATAYSYESPNYRKNYSKRDFIGSFGQAVTWVSIKHRSTTAITETLADVRLELLSTYDMGKDLVKIPSNTTERWKLIDDKWWHIKKEKKALPKQAK